MIKKLLLLPIISTPIFIINPNSDLFISTYSKVSEIYLDHMNLELDQKFNPSQDIVVDEESKTFTIDSSKFIINNNIINQDKFCQSNYTVDIISNSMELKISTFNNIITKQMIEDQNGNYILFNINDDIIGNLDAYYNKINFSINFSIDGNYAPKWDCAFIDSVPKWEQKKSLFSFDYILESVNQEKDGTENIGANLGIFFGLSSLIGISATSFWLIEKNKINERKN